MNQTERIAKVAENTGRSLRTKETAEIPASTVSSFKAGKAFQEKVNG